MLGDCRFVSRDTIEQLDQLAGNGKRLLNVVIVSNTYQRTNAVKCDVVVKSHRLSCQIDPFHPTNIGFFVQSFVSSLAERLVLHGIGSEDSSQGAPTS